MVKKERRGEKFMKYVCELCGYIYDEKVGDIENGVDPNTDFDDLPRTWVCPMCAAEKNDFEAIEED